MLLVEPTIRVWEDKPGTAVSMHSVVDTYLGKYWAGQSIHTTIIKPQLVFFTVHTANEKHVFPSVEP